MGHALTYIQSLMTANSNGCFTDMLLGHIDVYKTIWNAFVGEVLVS